MPSVFTKIIKGELPSHKLAEDADHFSFLEIRPLKPGHALVVPKAEIDYVFDMEDAALGKLTAFAKKIAKAIKQAVPCEKVAMVVYGLQVRHTHIHLIPVTGDAGELDFRNAKDAAPADLAAMAANIKTYL